jgi:hypothetical protein
MSIPSFVIHHSGSIGIDQESARHSATSSNDEPSNNLFGFSKMAIG